MRRRTVLALALVPLIGGGGFFAGRLLARAETPRFDVRDWPRRGSGPRLVEYFDPGCASSRAVHRRLDQLLGARPQVEHVLVPVAISRGHSATPADVLCALDGQAAFAVANTWAIAAPDPTPRDPPRADRVRACAGRVEAATLRTAAGSPDGMPVVPRVELAGRTFIGADTLPELEAAVRAVRP